MIKSQQKGFTLIELVIVIVILGILGVTAAPKFMDMQSDARISAINGLSSNLKSANDMIFARAAMNGKHKVAYDKNAANKNTITANINGANVTVSLHRGSATQDITEIGDILEASLIEATISSTSTMVLSGSADWVVVNCVGTTDLTEDANTTNSSCASNGLYITFPGEVDPATNASGLTAGTCYVKYENLGTSKGTVTAVTSGC